MKKLLTFTAVCLLGTTGFAQVSVSNEKADYSTKQVSFTVTWTTQPYNNQIWVITDYVKVENATTVGSWSRALVTSVSASGNGSAATVTGQRGFWLNVSASSGSANITATLSLAGGVDKFNWCAYALDYPPKAIANGNGGYDLYGQPPFIVNGTALAASATTFGPGTCITSLTDATGNPAGIVPADATPAVSTVTASTLCAGNTAALTATLSGGTTSAMTYTWTIGHAAATATEANTYTTDILTADTPFTFTATNAYGCTGAYAGTITVNALPATPTGASAHAICGEGNIAFSVNEPGSGSTIDWYTEATAGNTLTENSATHTAYLSIGTYTYYAEARNETTQCLSAARLAVAGEVADPAVLGCPGGTCTVCGCVPGALAAGGYCFDWSTIPYRTNISLGSQNYANYSANITRAVAFGLDATGATVRRSNAAPNNHPVYCCSDSACSQTYTCAAGTSTYNGWTYVLPK
ncbi:MAG: hypothetical protein LBG31_06425 [Prevotellaceae bacterium]|jgi:hypothetical protein|nr:hypothetical protein [Prevotellaceae bacterium]